MMAAERWKLSIEGSSDSHRRRSSWDEAYDPNCLPTFTYADTLYQYAYAPNGNLLFENTRPYTNVGSGNWWYGSQTHFSDYIWLGGEPIAVWRDGSMYAISNDHLGRPEVVTNTAGAVVWRARNLAYHREQTVNNSNFGSLGLSFPGQYLDAESGMAYNWHRVYDPSSGRYTQSDPIGLAGGVNTFAYVGGNPVNRADPSGLETVGPWTYAPGTQRDAYYAARSRNVTLNFQTGLGGSLGYFIVGVAGEGGFAVDTNGTMCFYAKGCGATPAAGGIIAGASVQGGASCGVGDLVSGTENSFQLQLGGFFGGGLKGSVETSGSGGSAGLNGGVGWQASGGLQMCQTKYWCVR